MFFVSVVRSQIHFNIILLKLSVLILQQMLSVMLKSVPGMECAIKECAHAIHYILENFAKTKVRSRCITI